MLHPYREAAKTQISLPAFPLQEAPGRTFFSMLCDINHWLAESPCVYGSAHGTSLYILYKNVAYLIDDFWEAFSLPMAAVGHTWPVCVFGTAQNQETVQLSAEAVEKQIQLIQRSISGQKNDELESLCIQVDLREIPTKEIFLRFLDAVDWQSNIAPMDWKDSGFLRSQELIAANARGLFCYAGLELSPSSDSCLSSLRFSQKIALWNSFLQDSFEPIEFEWLAGEITENSIDNRMEWELALTESMAGLGFRIVNQENSFELFDGQGCRLYFGSDCRRAAERALLKLLFPLND